MRKATNRGYLLSLIAVIAVMICSGAETLSQNRSGSGLENIRWQLVKLNGRGVEARDSEREPYLRLDRATGGIGMSVGCNNIGGEYQLRGRQLKIEPGPMTRMFCEDLNQLEQEYIEAAGQVTGWRVERGRLLLLAGEKVVMELTRSKRRK